VRGRGLVSTSSQREYGVRQERKQGVRHPRKKSRIGHGRKGSLGKREGRLRPTTSSKKDVLFQEKKGPEGVCKILAWEGKKACPPYKNVGRRGG